MKPERWARLIGAEEAALIKALHGSQEPAEWEWQTSFPVACILCQLPEHHSGPHLVEARHRRGWWCWEGGYWARYQDGRLRSIG